MRRRWRRAVAVVLAGGVLAVGAVLLLDRGPHGAPSPQALVDGYLDALRGNDRGALADLADPDHDAAADIPARLRALGAGRLVVTSTTIGHTESDALTPVDIDGILDGRPYHDALWLYRHGQRWYVGLGPSRRAGHPKPTGAGVAQRRLR
jgi:hypothetical protein